jgi:hypothetical protein
MPSKEQWLERTGKTESKILEVVAFGKIFLGILRSR